MERQQNYKGTCKEGVDKVIMNRIAGAAKADITQATISAITYIVDQYDSEINAENDTDSTSVIPETSAGSVASLVFDTLQTDNDWDADEDGYNFKLTLPASSFPTGGKWYRVEVWFDPTTGSDFPVQWVLECHATSRD